MIARRRLARIALSMVTAAALGTLLPSIAWAHPLGNFTINHYAGITVGRTAVHLDAVLDLAEIPTFTERQRIDTNGDGQISASEVEAERLAACPRLAPSLHLSEGASALPLTPTQAGLSFPPGAGGLPTMRVVCEFIAPLAAPLSPATPIAFTDASYSDRIGWREIVVTGDGVTLQAGPGAPALAGDSVSGRLTHYPTDLLSQPLDERTGSVLATIGGPASPPVTPADASALEPGSGRATSGASGSVGDALPASATISGGDLPRGSLAAAAAAVPGGVGTELGDILGARDLTPTVVLASLLIAIVLGAAHAVSPGHGKTIMAAYLVGSRGTAGQAVILGLAVTASHTAGVLVLAAMTLLAADLVPPERLYPVLGVASGLLVVGIGAWLLAGRVRAALRGRRDGNGHPHEHGHAHGHGDAHGHGHVHGNAHDGHAHEHGPAHEGGPAHEHGPTHDHTATPEGFGIRRLVALGLAGGLVPSASALLLLLGSLAAGRALFGVVLVVAFGLGMAFVLAGVGLVLVRAAGLLRRAAPDPRLSRLAGWLPTATAIVVIAAGVVLTGQALHQTL
ncbi:MAG TPA: hypothetical protein VEY67_06260 [Candidatus Dormibacteraeota bacterium]|nr:hypothetical protein [Candidatus Dormibacteraeota bacterium]